MKFKKIECISFLYILLYPRSDMLYNLNSAKATNVLYVCIKLVARLPLKCTLSKQRVEAQ